MIPVKVQCACGQRYSFEVEPVHGRMPVPVACPVCGADGTAAANAILAGMAASRPVAVAARPVAQTIAVAQPVAWAAPAPVASGLRVATAVAGPPPIPAPGPPPVPRPAAAVARGPYGPLPAAAQKPKRGRDGWNAEETGFNKLGTYITTGPSLLAALLAWGIFGVEVPGLLLGAVVGVCGVIGGIMNVYGRGPIWAGAIVGPVMGLGGFGAVYYWAQGRESAYKYELAIAFLLGCAPGMGLQWLLQRLARKMSTQPVAGHA